MTGSASNLRCAIAHLRPGPSDHPGMTARAALLAIAETPKQCFIGASDSNQPKAAPMLDVPKNADKSYADGKILQSITDGVGVITFNNPEKRNALSLDMWQGLGLALVELRDDPRGGVVILVGPGDRAFVRGADTSHFEKPRHNAAASEEYAK